MRNINKFTIFFFICLFTLFLIPKSVFAGTFQLKKIGGMDTNGANYKHWWYSSVNPTLSGSALAGAGVDITIDSLTRSVTADSNGNWSYAASLAEGDHTIMLNSSGSTIAFSLTIGGALPENIGAPAANQTPVVGIIEPTLALVFLGLSFLLLGIRFTKI